MALNIKLMDLPDVAQNRRYTAPRAFMPGIFKVGDLFQFIRFKEKTEFISIDWKTWYFKDFYCEVTEVLTGYVKIHVYSIATDESILSPGRSDDTQELVPGTANLHFEGQPYIWFIPYSRLDISRINLSELEDDALIPEELYA